MTPTPEQTAIVEAVASGANVMVEALAGCAKSTTILQAIAHLDPKRSTAILAFNTKIKKEMESKIAEFDLGRANLQVLTLNGLGHRAIAKSTGRKLTLDNDKIYKLAKDQNLRGDDLSDTMHLARTARQRGLVPGGIPGKGLIPDEEETWIALCNELDIQEVLRVPARSILLSSTKAALQGTVDFDDQIYVSSLIFGSFEKFDTVFVDESQDLSPLNHLQLRRCSNAQLVSVGDSHQAIYAWRGADAESMRNLRSLRDTWVDRTLSVTFRCPKAVVQRQQSFVPGFRAGPGNLQGSIASLKEWNPDGGSSTAILCRNNAPLIRLAFKLLRERVPVNLLGKDLGRDLKRFYNKVSNKGTVGLVEVKARLEDIIEHDPNKADKAESLLAILDSSKDLDDAIAFLTAPRQQALSLATGHKAKGLEWSTVYHLEPGLIPSRHAETDIQLQQEFNLRYVIETRTKDALRFVRMEGLTL